MFTGGSSSVTQKRKQSKRKLSKAHMTENLQERGLEVPLKYYLAIILFGVAWQDEHKDTDGMMDEERHRAPAASSE